MFSQTAFILACVGFNQISNSFQADYTIANANNYVAENSGKINQQYRLKYHFMPPLGWTNDPNGFIYYKGEYHLFYQFNPYNTIHNKIHWGHAKSKDLLHWEYLPVALAPDHNYDIDGIFSGSAIEKDGKLYVMYTGYSERYGQVQCIAVSDDGIVFTKIPQNPVLDASTLPANAQPQDFRDPKVFKHGDAYYVVLASKTKTNTGQILMYKSSDLINWTFKSIILEGTPKTGVMWECPDLFQLDGKDVLLLSPIEMPRSGDDFHNYDSVIEFVGRVDWETGKMVVEVTKELDHGMDFYATQSLLDNNGRRIIIAWMSMWKRHFPTHELNHGWVGQMTIPRELHLKNGYVIQAPACDFTNMFKNVKEYTNIAFNNEVKEFEQVAGTAGVLDLMISFETSGLLTIELLKNNPEKTVITYDSITNLLQLNLRASGIVVTGVEDPPVYSRRVYVPLNKNTLKLQILIDTSSVEIFANDGVETLSANVYPTKENSVGISFGMQGKGVIESLRFSFSGSSAIFPKFFSGLFLTFVMTLYNLM